MSTTQDRGSLIWYELMTDDPAGASAFYGAVVGWTIAAEGNAMLGGGEYRMIGRADGGHAGGVLTITPAMAGHGVKPGWFGYVHVPDVDAAAAKLVAAGGAVHMPATDMPVGRIAMVSDPWGAVFYLMDPVPPPGQPDAKSDVFDPDQPQRVRWHDLWTGDQDAAQALYADLFGWQQQGEMPMGDGRVYRFMANGQGLFGGIGPALPDGRGPRWDITVGVADIDRAAAAVEANGGALLGQPHQVPGGDYMVHIRDPQGAHLGLVGPRKE
ncbi:MAG: VOC family protein [Erythrobacter sp.]|nr:VOC family protein [Erythrobacter sp.]